MGKLKVLGDNWIQYINGDRINVSSFEMFRQGYLETKLVIEGKMHRNTNIWYTLAEYKKNEIELFEEDFKMLLQVKAASHTGT